MNWFTLISGQLLSIIKKGGKKVQILAVFAKNKLVKNSNAARYSCTGAQSYQCQIPRFQRLTVGASQLSGLQQN